MNIPNYWMGRLLFWLEEDGLNASRKIPVRACCDVAAFLMVMDGVVNGIESLYFSKVVVSLLLVVAAINFVLVNKLIKKVPKKRN